MESAMVTPSYSALRKRARVRGMHLTKRGDNITIIAVSGNAPAAAKDFVDETMAVVERFLKKCPILPECRRKRKAA
jgi:hypothetical protein